MLATFLLAAATLAPTSADPSAPASARRAAADVLRTTLTGLEQEAEGSPALPRLLAAGQTAAEALGPSQLATTLRASLYEARWRDVTAPGSAAEGLEQDLRRTLGDLDFEPVMEADLPEGFPAPTPVGEVEVKRYPVYRIARADSGGTGAFWQLFQHIQKHDIPMTAPVEMTYDASGDEVDMAFMYEHAAQGSTGPDGSVEVTDIPPMLVASMGCRGRSTDAAVARALDAITSWILEQDDLEIAGPVRQFGYNGPSVPSSRKYFEVQIPVRRLGDDGSTAGPAVAPAGDDVARR